MPYLSVENSGICASSFSKLKPKWFLLRARISVKRLRTSKRCLLCFKLGLEVYSNYTISQFCSANCRWLFPIWHFLEKNAFTSVLSIIYLTKQTKPQGYASGFLINALKWRRSHSACKRNYGASKFVQGTKRHLIWGPTSPVSERR